jgi:hypothetical protein
MEIVLQHREEAKTRVRWRCFGRQKGFWIRVGGEGRNPPAPGISGTGAGIYKVALIGTTGTLRCCFFQITQNTFE